MINKGFVWQVQKVATCDVLITLVLQKYQMKIGMKIEGMIPLFFFNSHMIVENHISSLF